MSSWAARTAILVRGARLPGDVPNLHQALGNFRDLQLKQTADQIGMGPGDKDLGAAVGAVDVHHVDPDEVALLISLPGDLFPGAENGVGALRAVPMRIYISPEGSMRRTVPVRISWALEE